MNTRDNWPPRWLDGIAPTDSFWAMAWAGCLQWSISEPGILERFQKDTGTPDFKPRSVLDRMIDRATGLDEAIAIRYVKWFNENIWGGEGLPTTSPKEQP